VRFYSKLRGREILAAFSLEKTVSFFIFYLKIKNKKKSTATTTCTAQVIT
jgi:hypothetical protein